MRYFIDNENCISVALRMHIDFLIFVQYFLGLEIARPINLCQHL